MKKPVSLGIGSSGYEILQYLIRHPKAQDTVEGIVEWWLLEQRIVNMMGRVKSGLAELTAKTLVNTRESRDGRIFYRINRRKIKQIQAILASA